MIPACSALSYYILYVEAQYYGNYLVEEELSLFLVVYPISIEPLSNGLSCP